MHLTFMAERFLRGLSKRLRVYCFSSSPGRPTADVFYPDVVMRRETDSL